MTTSVFRDIDDDGRISIFCSGSQILFVCDKGHWWIAKPDQTGKTGVASPKHAREIASLKAKFGPEPLAVMGYAD